MDRARLLGLLRRKIDETDLPTSDRTDEELLEYIKDAAEELGLRRVSGMTSFTIVSDAASAGYGISPNPTTEQGHMLATLAALELLRDEYRGKLNRGELGVNWKSGLESESTIAAEKAWREQFDDLESWLEHLIIMHNSGSHATRPQ